MTIPIELPGGGRPNANFRYAFKKGMNGWDVWALQVGLNSHQQTFPIFEDGYFGPQTESCVKREQTNHHLTVDGICGPASQHAISVAEAKHAELEYHVPVGLLRGLAVGESGLYFAAVSGPNHNNSYDAGVTQDNLVDGELGTLSRWHNAFDLRWSFAKAAIDIATAYEVFEGKPGCQTAEATWKCALGSFNWPAAAAKVAAGTFGSWRYYAKDATGAGRYYGVDEPAYWVIAASGGRLSTGRQWWNAYVESKIMYVTSWSV